MIENKISVHPDADEISVSAFKEYDIRGVLSDDFITDLGSKVANKYGSLLVMSDSKKSSIHYSELFINSVINAGFNVINAGVGPTDMCSFLGRKYGLVSVMFTASHLSDFQDGVKFHDSKGVPFSNAMINELKSLQVKNSSIKGRVYFRDLKSQYFIALINRYYSLFKHDISGLRVIIDLRNGSGITHEVLSLLGASVTVINNQGADPLNSRLDITGYDLGLIHDFDADRIVVVSKEGPVHGSLIACLLTSVLGKNVVASIDSSQVLSLFANVSYSRVGDPFVVREIIRNNASFGVEPSGHYTDPLFCLTSSGALFACLIAGLVMTECLDSRLLKIPNIIVEHAIVRVRDKDSFMSKVLSKVGNVISSVDGVKFIFNGSTALVRPSSTDSLIRFQVENPFKEGLVNDLVRWLTC